MDKKPLYILMSFHPSSHDLLRHGLLGSCSLHQRRIGGVKNAYWPDIHDWIVGRSNNRSLFRQAFRQGRETANPDCCHGRLHARFLAVCFDKRHLARISGSGRGGIRAAEGWRMEGLICRSETCLKLGGCLDGEQAGVYYRLSVQARRTRPSRVDMAKPDGLEESWSREGWARPNT